MEIPEIQIRPLGFMTPIEQKPHIRNDIATTKLTLMHRLGPGLKAKRKSQFVFAVGGQHGPVLGLLGPALSLVEEY
jgi:hypothetical protein